MSNTLNDYAIKGILSAGEQLYLNEDAADFHFICKSADGKDERIPVHKLLLGSISDVFRAMFSDSWKDNVEVVIPDANATEFKEFLQFFYLGRAKLTMDNIAKVMYLGDKYNVTECMDTCAMFLRGTLTDDNICWGYELAILYNQNDLKRFCEVTIAINTKVVFSSTGFLECNEVVLGHILKIDPLSCSEVEVFEGCMEWVKRTSGAAELTREIVQTHLGHLLYEIRFKSMTPQQFAALIPSYGDVFTLKEYKDISQSTAMQDFEPNIFSQNLRRPFEFFQCDKENELKCNRLLSCFPSDREYSIENIEKTTFSVNQPLLLKQIECCKIHEYKMNAYQHTDGFPTEIKIAQIPQSDSSDNEVVLYNGHSHLKTRTRAYVTLTKPILVRPGFMYEIELKQTPPPNLVSGGLLKSEVQMDSNLIVKFHGDIDEKDIKVARGVIIGLLFYSI